MEATFETKIDRLASLENAPGSKFSKLRLEAILDASKDRSQYKSQANNRLPQKKYGNNDRF